MSLLSGISANHSDEKGYNLTIFDLEEGKEYRTMCYKPGVYRVDGNVLRRQTIKGDFKPEPLICNAMFKEIKPKKTIGYYRHWFKRRNNTIFYIDSDSSTLVELKNNEIRNSIHMGCDALKEFEVELDD